MRLPWFSSDLLKIELLSTIKSKRLWGILKLSKCILQYDMATSLRSPGSGIRWFEWEWFPNVCGFEYCIPVGGIICICEELEGSSWGVGFMVSMHTQCVLCFPFVEQDLRFQLKLQYHICLPDAMFSAIMVLDSDLSGPVNYHSVCCLGQRTKKKWQIHTPKSTAIDLL